MPVKRGAAKKTASASAALRLARQAWRNQYLDAAASLAQAEDALARAKASRDRGAEAWARLTRGMHRMRLVSPQDGLADLDAVRLAFDSQGDRRGWILASAGTARAWWMQGRLRDALELALSLRAEGLQVLREAELGFLLNSIAGCYSSLGDSAQAFAYMYQALRDSSPVHNHGFDVVLYCNLSHELLMLGDCEEALNYVRQGVDRCAALANPRLMSVLLINRVLALTELGRTEQALPDIRRLLAIPADMSGRGSTEPAFESMAIAALRAGDIELGRTLIREGHGTPPRAALPDAFVEMAVAEAELLRAEGQREDAVLCLQQVMPLPAEGLSLRARCQFHLMLSELHESLGQSAQALQHLRVWQRAQLERARQASLARYQAASLRTELLRLQRERDDIDARRRMSERAKSELEAINLQLSQKVQEVQNLQHELRQQAVRDALTGLYNRRHFNEVLPRLFAAAQRERMPLSVVLIDLDHFKAVNDTYGHLAGDQLLAEFGALLLRQTRQSDVACRYGGEEFCLLLPRTDAIAAKRKVSALLRQWRGARFVFEATVVTHRTFSAGVADSVEAGDNAQSLLQAADDSVLEAKRLGRDRIVRYERVAGPAPLSA